MTAHGAKWYTEFVFGYGSERPTDDTHNQRGDKYIISPTHEGRSPSLLFHPSRAGVFIGGERPMTKKNTNTVKIGKGMTRRERWGLHARAYIDSMRGNETATPVEWLEEIEGRPLADVVVDHLAQRDGWEARDDDAYENAGARSRNAYERSVVRMEAIDHLCRQAHLIDRDDLHDFIKHFYHAGDRGLCPAIHRAVKCALASGVTA